MNYNFERKHGLTLSPQEQTHCYLGGKAMYAVENLCWGSAEAMVQSTVCCQSSLNNQGTDLAVQLAPVLLSQGTAAKGKMES